MTKGLRTRLCDLLGIDYPIIQGGMVHVATWELVVAVCEAGALGILGCGNAPPEWVRAQIANIRQRTQRPFGVNILFVSPYVEEIIALIISENVKIVTIGAAPPLLLRRRLPRLKEAGLLVIPLVGSPRYAKQCEDWGADMVVAEGMEAGGEIGDMATMPLVPQVVDAVDIPVIAAGGIADGRGLVAALSLGAAGIQMGTRFVASKECIAHPLAKEQIVKSRDRGTVVTGQSSGNPMRSLPTGITKKFQQMEREFFLLTDAEERRKKQIEAVNFGIGATRKGMIEGDMETGTLLAGQISGLIREISPVKEIIDGIMSQAQAILKGFRELDLD